MSFLPPSPKNARSQTRSSPNTTPPEPGQLSLLAPCGFCLREGQLSDLAITAALCSSDFLATWGTEEPPSPKSAGPPREENLWGRALNDHCQPGVADSCHPAPSHPSGIFYIQISPKLVHPDPTWSLSVKLGLHPALGRVEVRQWGTTLELCSSLLSLPRHREHGQCQLKHTISPPLARAARTVTSCQPWLRVIQHIIIVNTIQPM